MLHLAGLSTANMPEMLDLLLCTAVEVIGKSLSA